MPKQHQNHSWELGSAPPIIKAHSIAKHRVLEMYLRRYVEVLTSDPRVPHFKLTLIDGFSGGGLYTSDLTGELHWGSPFQMLKAMRESEIIAQQRRSKEFNLDIEYVFVEENRSAFDFLRSELVKSDFQFWMEKKIWMIHGTFVNQVEAIINRIKQRARGERAIFLLDQFGYKDAPLTVIRDILQRLPNAEVILTFAIDNLIDYLSEDEKTQVRLSNLGIVLSKESIRSFRERGISRWVIQTRLMESIRKATGAGFFTPFFIRSHDAHRDYWLIHLSGHSRARDVMVDLHWRENTSFVHYGRSGTKMLGYDPNEDPRLTRQKMLPEFCFDGSAFASSQDALFDELPEIIHPHKYGISFRDLFDSITNDTPATSNLIQEVLAELSRNERIEILDGKGLKSKKAKPKSWLIHRLCR